MQFTSFVAIALSTVVALGSNSNTQTRVNIGTVQVSPTTFGIGDAVTITYRTASADFPPSPYFIDFYLRGKLPRQRGQVAFTPFYLLSRNVYPFDEQTFVLGTQIPGVPTPTSDWQIWTEVIYPIDSNATLQVGSIPVSVTLIRD
ncbi:hypothetical protein VKT23_012500 [Stygiomarasmius scandens]|uniref:Uncharacterized protein n=1 Tax=Marasmiellus scandens TaxID=2682957 RepID=A0ABR1J5U1_9AGAR